ncbi:MarR family winged helix-turn-helix transcriptional regulator [Roseobacter sp. EG26]|uniref:MarR family winged helix-turn-helix transcriptional regulator n=1 Tax=Roseobacter sp. EG26 TaxID=3412477 RepID=UPI003CE5893A
MSDNADVKAAATEDDALPNPDPAHVAVWIALNRARLSLMRGVDRRLREEGLPPLTWYDVLWTIEKLGGAARPAAIVDELLFEPSALSHMARRMEAAGLLKTCVAEEDRRGRVLRITSKGLRARAAIWRIYGSALKARLAPLNELSDIDSVAKLFENIADVRFDQPPNAAKCSP